MAKALIAMSGGVDSSVAAKMMVDDGYECIGCTMKLFENEDAGISREKACCSLDDVEDAGKVAARLGMRYYVFNFTREFRQQVMDKFVQSYMQGKTPNPCIDCNRYLKFDKLLHRAHELECDCVVTGHYARIEQDPQTGKYVLRKGLDPKKDQSYVLYNLTQGQLAHIKMPLGGMTKDEVRALADASGFVNAEKPDSQDICFVPDGDYATMIERYTGEDFPKGEFTDLEGNVIGTHKGIIHYTIGQHKRLGQAFGVPRYVCRIDAAANQIALGGPNDVFSSYTKVEDFNWISGEVPEGEIRCKVKLRYKQQEQWATCRPVRKTDESSSETALENNGETKAVELIFDEPQRAITPGQAAVLYDGDIVLGGGTIVIE